MDFVDSALGTEHSGHDATVRGQQQTEAGVASMEGHPAAGTAPLQPNAAGTAAQLATSEPLGDYKQPPVHPTAAGAGVAPGAGGGTKNAGVGSGAQY